MRLGEFAEVIQYGSSTRATEEPVGVPMLRMNNIQADGWALDDLKYVDLPPKELDRYRLYDGDLVFNRTNTKELVGKSEVYRAEAMPPGEGPDTVFASYLIRVRLDEARALPDFVSAFLDTRLGRIQIDRVSRQIAGMTNINGEELRDLLIPLPPLDEQRRLVEALHASRRSSRRMLAEADHLLASLGDYLMDALSLVLSDPAPRLTYAVRASDLQGEGRLDPDYFHPERTQTLRVLQRHSDRLAPVQLDAVAQFVRNRVDPGDEPVRYLGLADVRPDTGELADTTPETPTKGTQAFIEGDVLYSRLRPNLNKVYRAEFGGVCSPEFHVIRLVGDALLPDFLAAVLRAPLTLAQTRHMTTGNTHPRLSNDDVRKLTVPVPALDLQRAVIAESRNRRARARALRAEAARDWANARAAFEARILGDAP